MFQAAVRSSRRKRNQYVVDLRHHVDDLRKRRNDLEVEHSLLEQLTSLWERLCKEVENEIQEGVKQQLGKVLKSWLVLLMMKKLLLAIKYFNFYNL